MWAAFVQDDAVFGRVELLVVAAWVVCGRRGAWSGARSGPARPSSETVAPGVQGLDEVQADHPGPDLSSVRSPTANEPEPVAELVVDRPDPLDEKTWKV